MAPDVSIIVVNRNTRERTLACLQSIREATAKIFYELIVVDNKSSDGSPTAIRQREPDATVIALQEPVGFAQACNQAAERAKGRFILVLDAGALVQDGAIDRLVAFARCTPDAQIWGGRTLAADRSPNMLSCAGRMTPWRLFCQVAGLSKLFAGSGVFNGEAYGGWLRDSDRVVDIVSSRCLLIRADIWRKLNGFDPALVMHGEDADLCLRAAKLGATPLITPDAEVVLGNDTARALSGEQLTGLLAARSTLIRKHWPTGLRWLGQALLQAVPLTHWLAASVASQKEAAAAWAEVIRTRRTWRGGHRARPIARAWAVNVAPRQGAPVAILPVGGNETIPTG